jgi:hypothetical protein
MELWEGNFESVLYMGAVYIKPKSSGDGPTGDRPATKDGPQSTVDSPQPTDSATEAPASSRRRAASCSGTARPWRGPVPSEATSSRKRRSSPG